MKKKRILHMNMDNIRPSGTFMLLYGMLDYLPEEYAFDFLGNFEQNEYSERIELLGGRMFSTPIERNTILRWHKIQEYVYHVCQEYKYEIVHIAADTAYKACFFARPAKKAGVKKIIVESHSSQVNGKKVKVKKMLHRLYQPLLKQYCDVCVACSDEAAKWMWPLIDNTEKQIHIIKNGITLEKYVFDFRKREEFRNKYSLNYKHVIGHISDFSPAKNPEFILEVFKRVYEKDSDSVLLLVGNEVYKQEILNKYSDKEFYKGIVDVGQCNNTEYAYSAMDLYIQPSVFEGLPIAVVEASANGLDILLSDGISKDAGILESTRFISTSNKDQWVEYILVQKKTLDDRKKANVVMRDSDYDVKTTLKAFLSLYKE